MYAIKTKRIQKKISGNDEAQYDTETWQKVDFGL